MTKNVIILEETKWPTHTMLKILHHSKAFFLRSLHLCNKILSFFAKLHKMLLEIYDLKSLHFQLDLRDLHLGKCLQVFQSS